MYLSIHLFIYVCLFMHLSIYIFISLPINLSIYLSKYLSIYLYLYQYIHHHEYIEKEIPQGLLHIPAGEVSEVIEGVAAQGRLSKKTIRSQSHKADFISRKIWNDLSANGR